MIDPSSINQIVDLAHIEDVVGEYVNLKRSGSRYKGNCPFHDEKTPSFVVTPGMGIYKCFGCQKGGNVIQFVMDIENLSFTESARFLAKKYGIDLIETNSGNSDASMEQQREKESLQALNDFALSFFQDQLLQAEEGRTMALPYFRERGYTQKSIDFWKVGYSPASWTAFYDHAKSKGYSDEVLLKAGLIKQRDKDGGFYDLFRNRVIFPLVAVNGKVIGFAGRVMSKVDKAPKYVNSPETLLYKKSDFLYALSQSKSEIRKNDKVYLMEGYTDVMTLQQAGIGNVAASSGTALTPGQIRMVKRFTSNVSVIYDGDIAGMKASLRGIDLLLEQDLNVRVIPLPEGQDPDSYCKELGSEGFQEYLKNNEQNFIVFKAELLLTEASNDPLRKSEVVSDILGSLSLINDKIKREILLQELQSICDIPIQTLYTELGKIDRKNRQKDSEKNISQELSLLKQAEATINEFSDPNTEVLSDVHQERALIRMIMLHGNKPVGTEELTITEFILQELDDDANASFQLMHEPYTLILEFVKLYYSNNQCAPEAVDFAKHSNPAISKFAAEIYSTEHTLSSAFIDNLISVKTEDDNYPKELIDIFLNLRRTKIEEMILEEQKKLVDPEEDDSEVLQVLDYLIILRKQIADQIGAVTARL